MAEETTAAPNTVDIDWDQFSDADLQAIKDGRGDLVSSRGQLILSGTAPESLVSKVSGAVSETAAAATPFLQQTARDIYDWTRGAKVQYPSTTVPILGSGGMGVSDLGLSPAKQAQLLTLVTSTLDPNRLDEGIKNIEPNAMTIRDKFGNVIASIPVRENGVLTGYKTFYPNPRGLDLPTITQLGGAATLAPILEGGAAAFGIPEILGARTVATIAGEAAVGEAASAASAEVQFETAPVATGTGWGSALYLANRALMKVLPPVASFAAKKFKSLFGDNPTIIDRNAQLTNDAVRYLKSVGIDPDQVQAGVYADLEKMIREGAVPEEALSKMQAQGLPVPVPLTTGQITGDMEQQLFEDLAAKGTYGDTAKTLVTDAFAAQEAAVKANTDEMLRVISAGGPTVPRSEGAAAAQAALVSARKAAKERADQMYTDARAAGSAFLDPATATPYGREILDTIAKDYNPLATPITTNILERVNQGFQDGISLSDLQVYRTQLSNQAKNGRGSDASAASEALKLFDEKLNTMAEQNLLYGDNEAVGLWAAAIKNYKQFADKWKSNNNILNTLTQEGPVNGQRGLLVPPEAAARTILTGSFSGLINKPQAIGVLRTLKSELPAAEWDLLRQDAFRLISDGITSASTGRTSNTFSSEWAQANRKNPGLLRVLFSPEEMRMINSFAATTANISRTAKNTSNTAAAMGSFLGRLFRSMGSTDTGRAVTQLWGTEALRRSYGVARGMAATEGRVTTTRSLSDRLVLGGGVGYGMTPETEEPIETAPTAPPQARVQPPAPSTRGLGPILPPTGGAAPAAPAPTGGPELAAQGPGPSSREMLQDLFPFDSVLRGAG